MIQARRIGHAAFETPDLDRAIDYYTQVNGLVLAEREENRAFLASKIGQLVVRLDRGASAQCTGPCPSCGGMVPPGRCTVSVVLPRRKTSSALRPPTG